MSDSTPAKHKFSTTTDPLRTRLWAKVDTSPGEAACWPWTATRTSTGYGMIRANGHMRRATRVAWELTHGPISSSLHVLHRCDNPPCCNPGHLFLGTHAENMADKVVKGRQSRTGNYIAANRTHCPQGHAYSEENTYIWRNRRQCRTCAATYKQACKDRKRNAIAG